jgi:2-keto-4-pentenoate hydratase/2-oxohepta-3-ene-1,7-dioic acid hydratase in catechol pathway
VRRCAKPLRVKLVRYVAQDAESSGHLSGDAIITSGIRLPLASVRLLAPCAPTKIIGVGRNYRDHTAELGRTPPPEPLLFLKPPSAVVPDGAAIVLPPQSKRVDYEGELAAQVILGYTICNDVTARDLQQSDDQWTRAKGFDTFAPLGPCVATDVNPAELRLRTYLNGELKQDAAIADLIFDVPALVAFISGIFTLEPGDVISTGTPAGIGPLCAGDSVTVAIDGIGELTNPVVAADATG